jgi:cobalt-zinc-cadmium efflux system protein
MTGHSHSHDHGHAERAPRRLLLVAAANGSLGVAQVVVGLIAGSVAVLADAVHQAVDTVAILLSFAAALLMRRRPGASMTFGWSKIDALGGYTSCLLLLASLGWIAYEAISRLGDPPDVDAGLMLAIGVVGLVVNGGGAFLLSGAHHLSERAARLHLLTDMAGSAMVVLAAILVRATDSPWFDPIASLCVIALAGSTTWSLLRAAIAELLDRTPAGLTDRHVIDQLSSHPDVVEVHHVHLRSLGRGTHSGSAHVVVEGERSVHAAQVLMGELRNGVRTELGIEHLTLQLECHSCEDELHRT